MRRAGSTARAADAVAGRSGRGARRHRRSTPAGPQAAAAIAPPAARPHRRRRSPAGDDGVLVTVPVIERVLTDLAARCRRPIGRAHCFVFTGSAEATAISTAASDLGRALSADSTARRSRRPRAGNLAGAGEVGLGDLLAGAASFADVIERDELLTPASDAGRPGGRCRGGRRERADFAGRLAVVAHALSLTYDVVLFDAGPLGAESDAVPWKPSCRAAKPCICLAALGERRCDDAAADRSHRPWRTEIISAAEAGQDRAAA